MLREWLIRLALVTFSIALVAVAAEVFLRLRFGSGLTADELRERLESSEEASTEEARGAFSLYGLVRASDVDDVVYELKPDLDGTFHDRPVRTNSFGLRDDEVTVGKPPKTVRIVGLGDSHMFGWGVGQGEAYLDVLERTLNDKSDDERRYEVINCAAPGYNTTMEVALYEHKCRAFEPDLVILHFVKNDFRLPHFLQPPREMTSVADWYLVELVRTAFREPEDDGIPELLHHDRQEVPAEVSEESRLRYSYMKGPEAFRRAMARLASLTAPDVPVVVSLVGRRDESHAVAAAVAEEMGFRVVDLAPALAKYLENNDIEPSREQWKELFQLRDDPHPSPFAHRLFGEALSEAVRPALP